MPVQPISSTLLGVDMTPREAIYTTVDASPTDATEKVIATLVIANFANIAVVSGIRLSGWAAITLAASSTALRLRIRQTSIGGTVKADTGALTGGVAAAALLAQDVEGFDSGAGVGTYVLTATVTGAAAGSTVSALVLHARVI